jgi:biotin carboxylase
MEKMEKKQIIILGAGLMQGPAMRIARELGLETVVVDADPAALYAQAADRFERIDLKDKEGVEALARSLQSAAMRNVSDTAGEWKRLAGIMTAGTDFSTTAAYVAEKLGLPGIPYEAALNASDKERMRRCFEEAGVPSPAFTVVSRADDFAPDFPVVVKPVDNMGARGCRRVDEGGELHDAVADALSFSRSGRVIIEEYMAGPEFSVDAIVYHGEITIAGLADRHIVFPPYFIEMGHTMPSDVDKETARALLAVFESGVRALGISNGAAKGDIKLTDRGPMIGEIAARLSGGYMSGWTYPYASGVEVTKAALQVAIGEKPSALQPLRDWTSAERAFISIPGRVRAIEGVEEARAVAGVKDLFLRIKLGDRVSFPQNNVGKAGNVISAAPSREAAVEAAQSAARSVLIRLCAPDAETEAFLRDAERAVAFPPDAFTLPPPLRALLEEVPETFSPPFSLEKKHAASYTEAVIYPFPAFEDADLRDYAGRTLPETLNAVRALTALALPVMAAAPAAAPVLGRSFWRALIRGGYQGAAYVVDALG